MTSATTETSRPIPQNIAIGTNELLSDEALVFLDEAVEAAICNEMRAGLGMIDSPNAQLKSRPTRMSLRCSEGFNASGEFHKIPLAGDGAGQRNRVAPPAPGRSPGLLMRPDLNIDLPGAFRLMRRMPDLFCDIGSLYEKIVGFVGPQGSCPRHVDDSINQHIATWEDGRVLGDRETEVRPRRAAKRVRRVLA